MCIFYLSLFDYTFLGITWFYDFTSRVLLNDVSLHFNHFYWTSLTYLGPFFLLQVCIGIFSINLNFLVIGLIALHLYLVEINDFLISNYTFGTGLIDFFNFNTLLTNNLNKYHPHIFYLSTIIFISVIAVEYNYYLNSMVTFRGIYNFKVKSWFLSTSSYLNVFALFLGSWWAFQEGTWGGWWNWDPSEVLGLLIFLTTLLVLHQSNNNLLIEALFLKVRVGVFFFVLTYFFTQLNFDLVSHNFGNRFTFFFTNTLFYFESALAAILVLVSILWLHHYRVLQFSYAYNTRWQLKFSTLFSSLLSLLWVSTVLISFTPLCNYFLWQYLHINMLNSNFTTSLVFYLTSLLIWVVFYLFRISGHYITTMLLTSLLPTPIVLHSFITWNTPPVINFLHQVLVIGLVLNLVLNQLSLSTLLIFDAKNRIIIEEVILQIPIKIYLCENSWREFYYCNFLVNGSNSMSYSISNRLTTFETSVFSFFQSNTNFINIYKLFDTYVSVNIVLDNPYFAILYETVLILALVYFLYMYSKIYKPLK